MLVPTPPPRTSLPERPAAYPNDRKQGLYHIFAANAILGDILLVFIAYFVKNNEFAIDFVENGDIIDYGGTMDGLARR